MLKNAGKSATFPLKINTKSQFISWQSGFGKRSKQKRFEKIFCKVAMKPNKFFLQALSLQLLMKHSMLRIAIFIVLIIFLQACSATRSNKSSRDAPTTTPSSLTKSREPDASVPPVIINTKNVDPNSVIDFAETLIGTKYKYGSAVREQGLDCSGFITYVFNHFKIQVPRVSRSFTNAGYPVPLDKSKPGDLILFTGTDTTGWIVGHMGLIIQNDNGKVRFIHSSSGKSIGVIISSLSKYYETRFVKAIRIFND